MLPCPAPQPVPSRPRVRLLNGRVHHGYGCPCRRSTWRGIRRNWDRGGLARLSRGVAGWPCPRIGRSPGHWLPGSGQRALGHTWNSWNAQSGPRDPRATSGAAPARKAGRQPPRWSTIQRAGLSGSWSEGGGASGRSQTPPGPSPVLSDGRHRGRAVGGAPFIWTNAKS